MLKIREVRKEKKISVKTLADAAGVTTASIYRYEEGTREPTFGILEKIAKSLGEPMHKLIGGVDDYDEKRHSGLLEE